MYTPLSKAMIIIINITTAYVVKVYEPRKRRPRARVFKIYHHLFRIMSITETLSLEFLLLIASYVKFYRGNKRNGTKENGKKNITKTTKNKVKTDLATSLSILMLFHICLDKVENFLICENVI